MQIEITWQCNINTNINTHVPDVEQVTNHAAIICYHQIINNNCTYMHIGVRDVKILTL